MACVLGMILWLPFYALEELLLRNGVLNTKDLPPFVGNEPGTITDYLLNAWHWDAISLGLFGLGILSFFVLLCSSAAQSLSSSSK
jgi:hypothetical protein